MATSKRATTAGSSPDPTAASPSRRQFLGAVAFAATAPLICHVDGATAAETDAQLPITPAGSLADPVKTLPRTIEALQAGAKNKLHIGAQMYVSIKGRPVADFGIGFSRIGVPMTPDSLMVWYSMSKAVTAVAIAQQWERGKLELDDPVARYIPEFAKNGKDKVTIRHVLTHTGGFPRADAGVALDHSFDDVIKTICDAKLEDGWVPGQRAQYHPTSGWYILGAIVQRIDRRPYSRYLREEIFEPLKLMDCWVGMPADRFRAYGDRIGAMMNMTPVGPVPATKLEVLEAWCGMCVPGANGHGPMRELGHFYEALLFRGTHPAGGRVLNSQTVEAITSYHRINMVDPTFKVAAPWGLGLALDNALYGKYRSTRTFGHGGSLSSMTFCDPEHGLVAATVCNGRPTNEQNIARFIDLHTALYLDLGLATPDSPVRTELPKVP